LGGTGNISKLRNFSSKQEQNHILSGILFQEVPMKHKIQEESRLASFQQHKKMYADTNIL